MVIATQLETFCKEHGGKFETYSSGGRMGSGAACYIGDKPDTYNGWSNRETWATHLWLTNEEPIYRETLDVLRQHKEPYERERALEEFVEELSDVFDQHAMFRDIGSLWRLIGEK